MMPHAIRRVYVARRARTAASFAIALVGTAMLVIAAKPAWAAYLAKGLPGINPAVLCTAVIAMWLVGLFTYFAARAVDEHRFAVQMSKLVMPGKDVNADVERLSHENPDQAARDMAHRLEVRSATLPVLAASVLLPVTALYIAATYRAGGWPVIAEFEASVAAHAMKLIACASVGAVIALAMTKRFARLPAAAPTALVTALGLTALAAGTSLWLVPPALILAAMAIVVRRLRVERDKLQAEDPAAGSEIWTIRGFIRQMRATGAAVITRVKKIRRRKIIIGGAVVAAGVAGALMMVPAKKMKPVAHAQAGVARVTKNVAPVVAPTGSKSKVEPMGDGRLMVTIDLVDTTPIDIPSISGMSNVPPTWNARLKLQQVEGIGLSIFAFGADAMQVLSIGNDITVTSSACGIEMTPLSLRVQGEAGHYVFYVEPVLTPAGC
jgi:hypothetical protein